MSRKVVVVRKRFIVFAGTGWAALTVTKTNSTDDEIVRQRARIPSLNKETSYVYEVI